MQLAISDSSTLIHLARINRFHFQFIGLLGILIRARMENNISSFRDEIEKNRTVGIFWISDSIMDKALTIVGEK